MRSTIIILLIIAQFNSALIGMESESLSLFKRINSLPVEKQCEIAQCICPKQWWYLDTIIEHNARIRSVCFDCEGKHLATVCSDEKARIFDIQTKQEIASFEHNALVKSVWFDIKGKCLATENYSGKSRIFDIQSKQKVASFRHNNDDILSVCFDTEGKRLAIGCYDKARIFDIESKQEIALFEHNSLVRSVCFDGEGKRLATACYDKKARIFDIELKQEIALFEHNDFVDSVCFDAEGKRLATACDDKKVRIFDIQSKQETASFEHNKTVKQVCFDVEGKRLATACWDNKARIFTHYDDYTLEQLQLKYALLTWLLIKKPNQNINTLEKLLADVALKCTINLTELVDIWNTFPKNMQAALWRTILYKIQKYGKIH